MPELAYNDSSINKNISHLSSVRGLHSGIPDKNQGANRRMQLFSVDSSPVGRRSTNQDPTSEAVKGWLLISVT
jgi:hypothetical protein